VWLVHGQQRVRTARLAGERRPNLGIDQGARLLTQKKEGSKLLLTEVRMGPLSGAGQPATTTGGGARTALGKKVAEGLLKAPDSTVLLGKVLRS
jgi:hypothetical protein